MAVHHRLPGRLANIEPDVVPGRPELLLNHYLALIDQSKHSHLLLNRHREKVQRVPERDYQQVPIADRVEIPPGITEIVPRDNIFSKGIAERAGHGILQDWYPRT